MQSVLISIKPKWCELIANGEKTIEVRKTRPKIETPFRCYIYCTKGKHIFYKSKYNNKFILYKPKYYNVTEELLSKNGNTILSGKVIGEFICDDLSKFTAEFTDGETYEDIRECYFDECEEEKEMIVVSNDWGNPNNSWICKKSCLSFDDFKKYIGENFHNIPFYGWNISSIKIYDKPKQLEQFKKYNRTCEYSDLGFAIPDCEKCLNKSCFLQRPPQSWCYVESL